jgi:hypothetical protein
MSDDLELNGQRALVTGTERLPDIRTTALNPHPTLSIAKGEAKKSRQEIR